MILSRVLAAALSYFSMAVPRYIKRKYFQRYWFHFQLETISLIDHPRIGNTCIQDLAEYFDIPSSCSKRCLVKWVSISLLSILLPYATVVFLYNIRTRHFFLRSVHFIISPASDDIKFTTLLSFHLRTCIPDIDLKSRLPLGVLFLFISLVDSKQRLSMLFSLAFQRIYSRSFPLCTQQVQCLRKYYLHILQNVLVSGNFLSNKSLTDCSDSQIARTQRILLCELQMLMLLDT